MTKANVAKRSKRFIFVSPVVHRFSPPGGQERCSVRRDFDTRSSDFLVVDRSRRKRGETRKQRMSVRSPERGETLQIRPSELLVARLTETLADQSIEVLQLLVAGGEMRTENFQGDQIMVQSERNITQTLASDVAQLPMQIRSTSPIHSTAQFSEQFFVDLLRLIASLVHTFLSQMLVESTPSTAKCNEQCFDDDDDHLHQTRSSVLDSFDEKRRSSATEGNSTLMFVLAADGDATVNDTIDEEGQGEGEIVFTQRIEFQRV